MLCIGDCHGDGQVTIDGLLTLVDIALGRAQLSACPHGIPSGALVNIVVILQAVSNALNGCGVLPPTPLPSPTTTPTPTWTAAQSTPTPTPAPGCGSNADCSPTFPYCGPDGNCWTQPCSDVCSDGKNCCGGPDFPYCGPDDGCWSQPCSTLCDSSCCGPNQQCIGNQTCSAAQSTPTPTPAPGCRSNADCPPTFPYCGPDGNCWTRPCSDVCSDGANCCGPDFPYCGPDDGCWSQPCSTLCGSTCCGPNQQCLGNTTCL